jgi:RimJ/RimL family protein N-acetyltransferase
MSHPFKHSEAKANKTVTPPLAIEGDHWIESLRDGTRVLVRPLRETDRLREEAFIRRLSPEARRFRFLGDFKSPTPELINQLMHVDYDNDMAFVALAHDDGELREVGISRYSRIEGSTACEFAITVSDDWCGRGLAVLLMRHLMDIARKHKLVRMFSMDDVNNEPMRVLANFLGFKREINPDDARSVIYTREL